MVTEIVQFEGENGDTAVTVSGAQGFVVYGNFTAVDGAAVVRVTFEDGTFTELLIPTNSSISFTQAGGGTPGFDRTLVITPFSVGGGFVNGQVSVETRQTGGTVSISTS